ncbi:MAG: hypothetical protein ABIE94_03570 [archaeon]
MNTKNSMRAIVTFILFISLIAIVSASIDVQYYSTASDFTVTSGLAELSVCQCAAYTDTITVINTAVSDTKFQVTSDLNFIKVVDPIFNLDKGDSKTVRLDIMVPCSAKGSYTANILVENVLGKQKTLTKTFQIGKCQNLQVDFFAPNVTGGVEPCPVLDFNLLVSNPGVFTDLYRISMSRFGNDTLISDDQFFLQPQQAMNVSLKTILPCGLYGSQDIVFNVEANNNKLKVSIPFNVDILQNYNYSTFTIAEPNFCHEDGAQSFQVYFKNEVKAPNNYSLSLVGAPSFVSLEQDFLELGPMEEKIILVNVDALERFEGEYDFVLHSESGIGNTYNDLDVYLRVWPCYNSKIDLPVKVDKVCEGHYEYDVVVRNDGRFEDFYTVTLEGPDFASLDPTEPFVLEREGSNTVKLLVDAPDIDSANEMTLTATASNGRSVSTTFYLETLNLKSCYEVALEKDKFVVYKGIDSIFVPVKSNGLMAGNYAVLFDNQNASWITMEDIFFDVEAGQSTELTILVEPEGKEFAEYTVGFDIVKGLEDQDLVYEGEIIIKNTDKPLSLKLTHYLLRNPCILAMAILLLAFIVFLIILVVTKEKPGRKRVGRVWVPLIILAVIYILVFAFIMYKTGPLDSIYPAVEPSDSKLNLTWAEDSDYKLNLSEYFVDPDADILSYSVSGTDYIGIKIKDNIATMKPADDWYGEEKVIFTAHDTSGAATDSPIMSLTVVDMPEYGFRENVEYYCPYINLIILFFVFVFIYALFYKRAGSGRPTKAQREAIKANNGGKKK